MSEWIGRTVSKVEIQKLLGRGGMAEVYLGLHTTLNRPVAVKILHGHLSEDDSLMARFRSEAQAVANLRHPNIVQVFDFDLADDRPYIVMELLEGPSLADFLRQMRRSGQRVPPEVLARLMTGLGAALDYAHAHGIVHRDVKPANVLLRREKGPVDLALPLPTDVQPVLTDFGVARLANSTVRTASGVIVGTPAYMSPEQVSGQPVDSRSDIYSLGVMLYEMVSNRLPFESDSDTPASTMIKHITEPPPPLPEVPPAVQAVVLRALAKDRDQRYQTAGDLADELRAAYGLPTPADLVSVAKAGARGISAAVPAAVPSAPRRRVSRRGIAAGLILAVLLIAAVGALWAGGVLSPDDDAPAPAAEADMVLSPAAMALGALEFGGSAGRVDRATITVSEFPPPPEGKQYEVWLLGGETRRSLGILDVERDGSGTLEYESPQDENLLATFGHFEITLEPSPDSNPLPTGEVVYSGGVPPGAMMHIGHLLISFETTPNKIGLVIGMINDAGLITSLAQDMLAAQEQNNLVEMKRLAEGMVNVIEGEAGDHYGDLDGDGEVYNPGDGFGLLPNGANAGYIQTSIEHARNSARSPDASMWIVDSEKQLETAAQNLGGWAAGLRDMALQVINSANLSAARRPVQQMEDLAARFVSGEAPDTPDATPAAGDEPTGGASAVFQYALRMADMQVFAGMNRLPEPADPNATPESMPMEHPDETQAPARPSSSYNY